MSNCLCEAAGSIAGGKNHRVLHFYNMLDKAFDRANETNSGWPFNLEGSSIGFTIVETRKGQLFWSSNGEYFETEVFCNFIATCVKRGWIDGPVSGSASFSSTGMNADDFGGIYFRITKDGDSHIITTYLDHLSDQEIAAFESTINNHGPR
jgi:hypothetical protein